MERPSPAKKYKWHAPTFFEGQSVTFRNHHGSERTGVVSMVRTNYHHTEHTARHTYYIRLRRPHPAPGEVRFYHLWITEENMLGVAPQ